MGAPFRPEVHQHRLACLKHFLLEVIVREFLYMIACH